MQNTSMSNYKCANNKNNKEIDADVMVTTDEYPLDAFVNSTEELAKFGKDIVVWRKETYYEDDRNVISVIINAISVRINIPRGTVKALMACLAALVLVIIVLSFKSIDSASTSDNGAETAGSETSREYPAEEGQAVNTERAANTGDYVIISSHYRYSVPEGTIEIWEPDDYYAENETFCDFEYADNEYTIRSYLLEYSDKELADVVKADLSQFDSMEFLDEQHIEGNYGDVLKIRFETKDDLGYFTAVTGYYWYESEPKICCLEVSSDGWFDDGVEEGILSSVYRVSSESGEVPPDAEEIWQEQQKEDAMNSLVEDAIRDQYEPEPMQDPLFD